MDQEGSPRSGAPPRSHTTAPWKASYERRSEDVPQVHQDSRCRASACPQAASACVAAPRDRYLDGALSECGGICRDAGTEVAPSGKVAGEGYAYWLQRSWQIALKSPPPGPQVCETVTVNRQQVALLTVGAAAPGKYNHTCNEPAGRPIYVQQLSDECSTFPGDHNGFGTTPSQLERCARVMFKGAAATASVDGHSVADFSRFITATGVYPVHVPKHNLFNYRQRDGRSAAYGYGLLLTGLRTGEHTILLDGNVPSAKYQIQVTYTLHVH